MTTCVKGMHAAQEGQVSSFVQLPSDLLRSGIPSDELHVYLILCDFAGKKSVCWPSDRTIGQLIDRSQGTVSRLIGRLEARGLISRTRIEITDENPTGRVIITHRRVAASPERQPLPHRRGNPASKHDAGVASNLRHDPDEEKKQHAGGSDVPGGTGSPPPAQEELQAAWDGLPESEREAILAAVKAENPGLARFPKLLHPICLETLIGRLVPLRIFQATGT